MELNNTKELTEFLYSALKDKYAQLNWQLYPQVDRLRGEHLPLASIELQSFELVAGLSTDVHTMQGQYAIRLLFNDNRHAQLNIHDAALAISTYLNSHTINNKHIETIEVISNQPDYLLPEVKGYINWEILFNVTFHYGDSIYSENGLSPDINLQANNNVVEKAEVTL